MCLISTHNAQLDSANINFLSIKLGVFQILKKIWFCFVDLNVYVKCQKLSYYNFYKGSLILLAQCSNFFNGDDLQPIES